MMVSQYKLYAFRIDNVGFLHKLAHFISEPKHLTAARDGGTLRPHTNRVRQQKGENPCKLQQQLIS
jgi:hypothetical protein